MSEERTTLLEFPCEFPLKIMGSNEPHLITEVIAVVCGYAPDFDPNTVEMRPSSKGNYMGLTCTIRAVSQEQLDNIYRALSSHPLVKFVL